ncbi:MAG: efflux RND transporter periplasmic adaptor subunit [Betaproteobacteria bacterium]
MNLDRILVAVAAAALLAGCGREPVPRTEEARPVRVVTVGAGQATRSFEFSGEIRARHETRLGFRVGGKIVERLVEVGALVKPGQHLARLDVSDLALAAASAKAQAASLEAERDLAAADLKRYRDLREKNFISQAEYERRASALATAEARLEALRAQHRQAANQAGYAVLAADTAGVIVGLEAEAGQVVAAGQTVVRVARLGEMEVAVAVPESERGFVERATSFAITLNALPGRSWKGRLRELSPAADPAARTYAARVSVLDAGEALELGMSARVAASANGGGSRIEVPIAALSAKGDKPEVFVVDGKGQVQPRAVKTAGISGERVVIESGLVPGEVVVAAGAQLLRAGQRVRVLVNGNGK